MIDDVDYLAIGQEPFAVEIVHRSVDEMADYVIARGGATLVDVVLDVELEVDGLLGHLNFFFRGELTRIGRHPGI